MTVRLRHRDGSEWNVTVAGLEATIEMVRGGQASRRSRTFAKKAELDRFLLAGRAQMEAAGYFEADSPAALRAEACARFVEELAAGIPRTPEVARMEKVWHSDRVQEALQQLLKRGDEGALVRLAAFPRAVDVLIRLAATSATPWQHQMAAWLAVTTRSPLVVPLVKLERLRIPDGPDPDVEGYPPGGLLWGSRYSALEPLIIALEEAPYAKSLDDVYAVWHPKAVALPRAFDPLVEGMERVERAG
ncbi:MAG: hypothetical protein ACOZNI_31930 [Myxococcota bacterium]